MNAQTVLSSLDAAYRNGIAETTDPGSAGTLSFENKGVAVFVIETAGAESRVLDSAAGYGVGTELVVVLDVAGGALTITGAESDVVLPTAGDMAVFRVSTANGTKAWRLVQYSGANFATSSFPIAFGTVDINSGDAATDTAIIALINALVTAGIATGTAS
jgi:hypothetical protein